jgi:endogenous inhibitor of DNA gyrase (YacG/DUF329 family)
MESTGITDHIYRNMLVRCPSCHKTSTTQNSPWRPFCSERCRLIDLGMWLTGGYRIPVHEVGQEIESKEDQDNGQG